MGATQSVNAGASAIGVASPLNGAVATTMSYTKGAFNAVLQAMQTAGSIEVVSNPRLKVLNGQTGIISSGNKIPYWTKEYDYEWVEDPNDPTKKVYEKTISYEKTDVLNGISLGVSPIIKKNGEVLLNIVPIVTNIEGESTFTDNGTVVATAPIINVKEVGTTILTKDNDMIVIGGLISSIKKDFEYKTPLLGDIPGLGHLFKRTEKKMEKRELVIMLKIKVDGIK